MELNLLQLESNASSTECKASAWKTSRTTVATDELRKKGLKAYFALIKLIQLDALSVKAVFKLFDALIPPVVTYGYQN